MQTTTIENPRTWDMDEVTHEVWQHILFTADRHAAKAINAYGAENAVPAMEDVMPPHDPALTPTETLSVLPELREAIEAAAHNPANQPAFGEKRSDITDATALHASLQVRYEMNQNQWTNLVKAAARAILQNTAKRRLATRVERQIDDHPPQRLSEGERICLK